MKKICMFLVLVLVLMATLVVAQVKPPQGPHFFFNCVTEFGPFIDSFDSGLFYWGNLTGVASIVEIEGDNVFKHVGGSYVGAVTNIAGSESWDNYDFEFDVMKEAGTYFNAVFRYVDESNHYMLEGGACGGACIKLWKRVGGSYAWLGQYAQPTIPGEWYHYTITLYEASIQIGVEEEEAIIDVTDSSHSVGKVGIGGYASTVYFDNVIVVGPNIKILKPNEILMPLSGTGRLGFTEGPTFQVTDNDMTDDNQAWVQVPAGLYDTFDQVRGKPGGSLTWGNEHIREKGKPEWRQHNDPLRWGTGQSGNWAFTNAGITCYSFRLYLIQ